MLVSFDIDDTLYNFKDTFQQAMDVAFQQLVKKEGRNVTFSTWFKVFQDCNQRLWPRFEARAGKTITSSCVNCWCRSTRYGFS